MNAEQLRALVHYDPDTGVFTWRVTRRGTARAGTVAGTVNISNKCDYKSWQIRVCNKRYLAHRLAWLYVYGVWPKDQIDHIDGDALNNRIDNLREATASSNPQNRKLCVNNKSGFTGVSWHKPARKWVAYISYQGKNRNLGSFDTPEEAHAAYLKAKSELHTFQPVPRE